MFNVSRSSLYQHKKKEKKQGKQERLDEVMAAKIRELILIHPGLGYRMIWALLRFVHKIRVNRKKVYRIMKLKGWLKNQRKQTPKPRVKRKKSVAKRSDERWAMDVTHIDCGEDGWGHLAAIIDCHDREIIGFEFALRGRAKEAERALESACISRFGTLYPKGEVPVIRSDNGLIFQSRRFREACSSYGLKQEFITPYCPQQNGMIERFFGTLKEECVWIQRFKNFEEARQIISKWIDWYNEERPHSSLGYKSPRNYRAQQVLQVA